ncbi:hypothetical protein ES703_55406 [subsurface metagenome]
MRETPNFYRITSRGKKPEPRKQGEYFPLREKEVKDLMDNFPEKVERPFRILNSEYAIHMGKDTPPCGYVDYRIGFQSDLYLLEVKAGDTFSVIWEASKVLAYVGVANRFHADSHRTYLPAVLIPQSTVDKDTRIFQALDILSITLFTYSCDDWQEKLTIIFQESTRKIEKRCLELTGKRKMA